jgi:hypothetical protein
MENRRFYNSVFNEIETELGEPHTVKEISERIDQKRINDFEKGLKKVLETLSGNDRKN